MAEFDPASKLGAAFAQLAGKLGGASPGQTNGAHKTNGAANQSRLKKRAPLRVGLGGSIPFVALFGKRFSRLPLVLNGVINPETGAHGPNESMHIGVYTKTVKANVHLYAELARALAK